MADTEALTTEVGAWAQITSIAVTVTVAVTVSVSVSVIVIAIAIAIIVVVVIIIIISWRSLGALLGLSSASLFASWRHLAPVTRHLMLILADLSPT